MLVWAIFTLMTAVAAVGVTIPLVRRHDVSRTRTAAVDVLGTQLRDIEAQKRAEELAPDEAEALSVDVARRLIAEKPVDPHPARPLGQRGLAALGLAVVMTIALTGTLLYWRIGRPDLANAPPVSPPAPATAAHPGGDIAAGIAQLEARMRQTPGDVEGWRVLAWSYMQVGRYADAANAYGRAARLAPANVEFASAQGEALTQASGGEVTPAARDLFRKALSRDAADPRARYFLAVAKDQAGDHAGAMADWIALLKSAPPGAPWAADVRAFVIRIAKANGENLAGKLPAPLDSGAGPPGPDAAQIAAAGQTPEADQQQMIRGMVNRLAASLAANPRNPNGWARLMRARMVLGQIGQATDAYRLSLRAYADSPAQRAALRTVARSLDIPGA